MRCLPVVLLSAALAAPALSQGPREPTRLVGLTFDHWQGTGGSALFRPTLRLTRYPARGPGLDLALAAFPDGIWPYPFLLTLGPQAGVVVPVHVGPVTLLAKGGVAGILTVGPLPGDRMLHLLPGAQAGLGLLIAVDQRSSIRLDVTRHVYRSFDHRAAPWSFGLGVTGGRRRR